MVVAARDVLKKETGGMGSVCLFVSGPDVDVWVQNCRNVVILRGGYMNHRRRFSGSGIMVERNDGFASTRRSAMADRRCAQRVGSGSFVDCGEATWARAKLSFCRSVIENCGLVWCTLYCTVRAVDMKQSWHCRKKDGTFGATALPSSPVAAPAPTMVGVRDSMTAPLITLASLLPRRWTKRTCVRLCRHKNDRLAVGGRRAFIDSSSA
mmetsp:Transcript_30786/g.95099  ORF Transcript_30786/g.95099 Transcript_30786/m.95099 type:complete len:209 (-) Transcript_30786:1821-2447(-)